MIRRTGKDVAVNNIPTGGRLAFQRTVKANPIYHSGGQGGAERAEGNVDFVGSYWAWGHTPSVFCNDRFTLAFTLTGGGTESGLTAANVLCTGIDIVVPVFDPSARNGVYYIVYFGAGGTDLTASAATAGATAQIFNVKGLACTVAGSAQTCIQSMKWSFRVDGEPFIDSCGNGVYDRPTGNLDWRFECRKTIDGMEDAPALNAVGAMQMEVTDALHWDATYGRVVGVEGVFDPQSREVLGIDITAEKCALAATGAVGTILNPAGATVWP
jgi:hypothetical protein